MEETDLRGKIMIKIGELVGDLMEGDDCLPSGSIETAISEAEVTLGDMVGCFADELLANINFYYEDDEEIEGEVEEEGV
jgi:hypothetical protein